MNDSAIAGRAIPVLRTHFRFQWEPAQECHVLLYPEGMVKLNHSAGEILACCDGKRSVDAIVEALQVKFPDAGDLAADVHEFFKIAHEQQWIEFED